MCIFAKEEEVANPCPHNENLVGQMLHISASSVQATKQQQAFERSGEKTIWDLRIFGK